MFFSHIFPSIALSLGKCMFFGVGRKKEKELLDYVMNSTQAEFVAIYGRRRV